MRVARLDRPGIHRRQPGRVHRPSRRGHRLAHGPRPGPQHSSITSGKAAAGWETFFPSVDHVVTGRGTYEKALTFDEWPYDGKRVIVLSATLAAGDARITVARSAEEALRELAGSRADQVYVDGGKVITTSSCH